VVNLTIEHNQCCPGHLSTDGSSQFPGSRCWFRSVYGHYGGPVDRPVTVGWTDGEVIFVRCNPVSLQIYRAIFEGSYICDMPNGRHLDRCWLRTFGIVDKGTLASSASALCLVKRISCSSLIRHRLCVSRYQPIESHGTQRRTARLLGDRGTVGVPVHWELRSSSK
jgi:hypothetical protein